MSARREHDAVLRLLRGEELELVLRDLGVLAAELSGWREALLAGGEASWQCRPAAARDAGIGRLKENVGDPTMANELLGAIGLCPPPGAMADEALVRAIRQLLQDSPFHGEAYRKLWARLRLARQRVG